MTFPDILQFNSLDVFQINSPRYNREKPEKFYASNKGIGNAPTSMQSCELTKNTSETLDLLNALPKEKSEAIKSEAHTYVQGGSNFQEMTFAAENIPTTETEPATKKETISQKNSELVLKRENIPLQSNRSFIKNDSSKAKLFKASNEISEKPTTMESFDPEMKLAKKTPKTPWYACFGCGQSSKTPK